jgi:putative flavoprotein involved in K+ transport
MTGTDPERHDVIVIGAGQGGLAAAHHLASRGIEHVVLEAKARVGDQWRSRYNSLRLYSPAKYDALPGLAFPLPGGAYPTGYQMADYLESYARHLAIPVRTGIAVDGLRRAGSRYVLTAGERRFESDQVVIAAGLFRTAQVPSFAGALDTGIRQFHSSEYHSVSQLAAGAVLVVGQGHSGADLAMEAVAAGHPTILSGKGHGDLPFSIDSRRGRAAWPVMKYVATNLLTLSTPIGRRVAARMRTGGPPLVRHRRPELAAAGVELTDARTVDARDGKPVLADGRVLDVANVIWCTGFRPDFSWIDLPIFGADGWPDHQRGVAIGAPGIYFLGLLFQYGFTSILVVGASRDAAYVVDHIARARAEQTQTDAPAAATAH